MIKFIKEDLAKSVYEGFFWVIDSKVYGELVEVTPLYQPQPSKTHSETWQKYRPSFVEKDIPFDYYPRGRVMVDPVWEGNSFSHYDCLVFIDPCLNNTKDKELIVDYYSLNYPKCHITWMGNLKQRAGIDHYSCHNCKNS